jgi:hypothetical protein
MIEAEDLVGRLLTAAGMIMEDTVETALIHAEQISIDDRVAAVLTAGEDIALLARTAIIIACRFLDSAGRKVANHRSSDAFVWARICAAEGA